MAFVISTRRSSVCGGSTAVTGGGDLDTRLKLLADVIAALSRASDDELLATYRSSLAEFQGGSIRELEEQGRGLEDEDRELAEVLQDATGQLYSSLQQLDGPEQVFAGTERAALMAQARQLLRSYARALRAWPAIREATQTLV